MRVIYGEQGAEVWRVRLTPSGEPADGDKRTLIDRRGVVELAEVLAQAESAPSCRVLVLEGEAGVFCQGLDLGQVTADPDVDLAAQVRRFASCLRDLRASSRVVVAAVDGEVAGGGVGLAAAADLLIATERSTFALPEVVLGLIPATVLPLLLERMPPQKARRLCLFGDLTAQEAAELGLVDRLVADAEQLERAVRAVIKRALRSSPAAVADLKALHRRIASLECSEALLVGADRTAQMLGSKEILAAIRGFLEGDAPPWFSRYRPGRS